MTGWKRLKARMDRHVKIQSAWRAAMALNCEDRDELMVRIITAANIDLSRCPFCNSESQESTISQRDAFHDRIDEIADALGDETEWTSANDRGARALDLARELRAEVDRLREEDRPL